MHCTCIIRRASCRKSWKGSRTTVYVTPRNYCKLVNSIDVQPARIAFPHTRTKSAPHPALKEMKFTAGFLCNNRRGCSGSRSVLSKELSYVTSIEAWRVQRKQREIKPQKRTAALSVTLIALSKLVWATLLGTKNCSLEIRFSANWEKLIFLSERGEFFWSVFFYSTMCYCRNRKKILRSTRVNTGRRELRAAQMANRSIRFPDSSWSRLYRR